MRVPSNVISMPQKAQVPERPTVDPTYLAMAAASLHAEGKLNPKPKKPA